MQNQTTVHPLESAHTLVRLLLHVSMATQGIGVLYYIGLLFCFEGPHRHNTPDLITLYIEQDGIFTTLHVMIMIITMIAWSVWLVKLAQRARHYGQMTESPFRVVISYIIPIYALWGPYSYMKRLMATHATPTLVENSSSSLLSGWWSVWVVFNMSAGMLSRLSDSYLLQDDLLGYAFIRLIDITIWCVVLSLSIQFISQVTRRQIYFEEHIDSYNVAKHFD